MKFVKAIIMVAAISLLAVPVMAGNGPRNNQPNGCDEDCLLLKQLCREDCKLGLIDEPCDCSLVCECECDGDGNGPYGDSECDGDGIPNEDGSGSQNKYGRK